MYSSRKRTTSYILSKITKHFSQLGYEIHEPTGLISQVFPGTFNPSAAHGEVMRLITDPHRFRKPRRFFVIEQCFRHVDLNRVGRAYHSAFFEMVAYVLAARSNSYPKREVIQEAYNLLVHELGFDPTRLYITVFGGGEVKNSSFKPDTESIDHWNLVGIPEDHIILVPGENNFIYLQKEGDAAGPRCEIFYDRGVAFSINRFVEVGSVIFEEYYFSNGRLVKSTNIVGGGAFGLERLVMALSDLATIYHIDTFSPLVQILKQSITDNKSLLFPSMVYQTADFLKASVFIINSGQLPDSSKRGQILKKLIRTAFSNMEFLGIPYDKICQEITETVLRLYGDKYSELRANRGIILRTILEVIGRSSTGSSV